MVAEIGVDTSIKASEGVGEPTSISEISRQLLTFAVEGKTQDCGDRLESSLFVKSMRGSGERRGCVTIGGPAMMEKLGEIEGCGRLELNPLSGAYHQPESASAS
jgi:hypothetical protein